MDKNVGGLDRTARLVGGALLVVAGVAGYLGVLELGLTLALLAVLVGLVLVVTGAVQRCPIWAGAKVNTLRR